MESMLIGAGTEIVLHFSLALEDGQIVDSNLDNKPATFIFGDGNLLPGFEEVLVGLKAGQERAFLIPPEKGFGQPNPNNVQLMTRDSFHNTPDIQIGLVIGFADASGGEMPGVIKALDGDEVEVDFNHPLAGKTINFQVKIISVKPSVKH